jgi:hypothetical protein
MGLTLRGAVAAASRRVVSIKMVLSNGNLLSIYCSELQQQQRSSVSETRLVSRRVNHDSQTAGLSHFSLSLSLSFLKTDMPTDAIREMCMLTYTHIPAR